MKSEILATKFGYLLSKIRQELHTLSKKLLKLSFILEREERKKDLCAIFPLFSPSLCHGKAALQVGGHGERLHQCREVTLLTYKSIPMQVDGEPCRLAPSLIRISLRNQANMVQKSKRRTSMPLLNE